jgi:hypothetical protein
VCETLVGVVLRGLGTKPSFARFPSTDASPPQLYRPSTLLATTISTVFGRLRHLSPLFVCAAFFFPSCLLRIINVHLFAFLRTTTARLSVSNGESLSPSVGTCPILAAKDYKTIADLEPAHYGLRRMSVYTVHVTYSDETALQPFQRCRTRVLTLFPDENSSTDAIPSLLSPDVDLPRHSAN